MKMINEYQKINWSICYEVFFFFEFSYWWKDKIHYFGVNDLTKFKEQVEKWSKLKFYKGNNKPIYILVQTNRMT